MEILNEDYVKIDFDNETEILSLTWLLNPTSEEIRSGLNTGSDFVKENGVKKWIGDTNLLGVIAEEDMEWINNEWFPSLLAAGIKKMAVILPDNVFGQMNVEDIMGTVDTSTGFESRYFDNVEEATSWILEENNENNAA